MKRNNMRPLEEQLDEENREKVESLGMKVSQLKDIALQIQDQAKSDNSMLVGMKDKYGGAGDLLSGTIKKLEDTLKGQSKVVCCYLVAVVIFVIWILYKVGS